MTLALTLPRVPAPSRSEADRPRTSDWPIMGDIVSARGGVPEHLIRWRRAAGESDPEPRDPFA